MNIVLIITDNYPYKLNAGNVKAEYMALGFMKAGCKVSIVDQLVGQNSLADVEYGISPKGIPFYRLPQKTSALFSPLKNFKNLKNILKNEKEKSRNIAIIYPTLIPYYFRIIDICHSQGYKVFVQYHEYFSSFPYRKVQQHWDFVLRDKFIGCAVDGVLPISHFLESKASVFKKPQHILPIIADYSRILEKVEISNAFTFCGSAAYILRYTIFLDAFSNIVAEFPQAKLNLIVFGTESEIDSVKLLLEERCIINNTSIFSQIPQDELFAIYDSSLALLIPLDPYNLQDKARFSQKIAEYVGSKRPIITTNVGEIPYYFSNKVNALIVDYSVDGFTKGMSYVLKNPQKATEIGYNGYLVGLEHFDYVKNSISMIDFFEHYGV